MTGRIQTYIHSDSITQNKGGALVHITCDTDFAAKTQEFIDFCNLVAKLAFASKATVWTEIVDLFPDLNQTHTEIQKKLKETIKVVDIKVMLL